MTEVKPWSYYEKYGSAGAEPGRQRRLHSEVKWGAVLGTGAAAYICFRAGAPEGAGVVLAVAGAAIGAIAGYVSGRHGQRRMSESTAEMLYATDWARAHGLVYRESLTPPRGAPYAHSGSLQIAKNEIRGEMSGLLVRLYNLSYVDENEILGESDPITRRFNVMQLTGPGLPLERMSLLRTGAAAELMWKEELRGSFAPELTVSLESVEFNNLFDLKIGTAADEVAIRQIFDPATIDRILKNQVTFPNLIFSSGSWWLIEKEHYSLRQLDAWLPKQKLAADAVKLLSRVQSL